MGIGKALLLAAAVAALSPPASAKDEVKRFLEDARTAARASEHLKAAGLYGDALAMAQRRDDLLGEQEAADAFLEFLSRVPAPLRPGTGDAASSAPGRRECLAAVMAKLDPKRCGAFVGAPALAGELLLDAVQTGDGKHVEAAIAALGPSAAGKQGKGNATLARLGFGVKAARGDASSAAGADADLQFVVGRASEEGWIDLNLAACVERTALQLRLGDAAKAKEAAESVVRLLPPKADPLLFYWTGWAIQARFQEAPEEVREILNRTLQTQAGGAAGAPGGAGGAGQDGGGPAKSPLGAALSRPDRGDPLAFVLRTKEGFEFRVPWDVRFKGVLPQADGVRHLDEGGLTLAFCGWGVAVRMADPVGNRGQPGAGGNPDSGRAFYRLARGETWKLLRDGSVQITGK